MFFLFALIGPATIVFAFGLAGIVAYLLFVAGDQLLKGAALNAVQIAEQLCR